MQKLATLVAVGSALATAAVANAAFTVTYNFDTTPLANRSGADVTGTDALLITAAPFVTANTTNESSNNQDVGFSSTGGGQAFIRTEATGTDQAAALADDDFLSFTVSVNTPLVQRLDLSSLTFNFGGSGNYTNTVYVQSSVGGLGTGSPVLFTQTQAISGSGSPALQVIGAAVPVSSTAFDNLTTVTFQFRFSDSIDSGNAVNRIANVVLNGDVVLAPVGIPEPASLGLLGVGAALLLGRRRRS